MDFENILCKNDPEVTVGEHSTKNGTNIANWIHHGYTKSQQSRFSVVCSRPYFDQQRFVYTLQGLYVSYQTVTVAMIAMVLHGSYFTMPDTGDHDIKVNG